MLNEKQDLKIALFNQGLKVSNKARLMIQGANNKPLSTGDYASTSGIALNLGDDIYVNAPVTDNHNFVTDGTPYLLDIEDSNFVVRIGDRVVEAQYIPVPGYYESRNANNLPYNLLAVTHIDRVRISPIEGCSIACQFCNLPYEFKYQKHGVEDLVDSVGVALKDPVLPAQHVLISGGTPKPEDYKYQNQVYEQVCATYPGIDVDIMMAPAGDLLDPRLLKSFGIHGLAINLELYNPEVARKKARGKYNIGREKYLKFIEYCVAVFGAGKIRSLLMVGIEPIEDTLKGVQALVERGCDPVLSPFIPDPATPLKNERPPSIDTQKEVYLRAQDIVSHYPDVVIAPRCIPCQHNTLAFPDDSGRYYRHSYKPS